MDTMDTKVKPYRFYPSCPLWLSMRNRLEMLAQQIPPEVAFEIAPDRVDVVAVVLGVVELDEERRTLHAIVVLLPALRFTGPGERHLLRACLAKLRRPL